MPFPPRKEVERRKPYGDVPLIADTSAWTAIRRSRALGNTPRDWTNAWMGRQLLVSPVVRLELLHDAKSADDFEALDHLLGFYDEVPVSARTFKTAIAVRELAVYGRSPGFHRVGMGDALIAASAQERGVGVLHYNARDFDKLAVVLSFESVLVAPLGKFERQILG